MTNHRNSWKRSLAMLALLGVALTVLPGCLVMAEPSGADVVEERRVEHSVAVTAGQTVRVENIAGSMRVVAGPGPELQVTGTVFGGGDDQAEATAIVERMSLAIDQHEGKRIVRVEYPLDESTRIHYNREAGGFLDMFDNSSSRFEYADQRVQVSTRRSQGAMSAWADLTIAVPPGIRVEVLNGVGRLVSEGVRADQSLNVYSGSISTTDSAGVLVADTGSGSIEVNGHRGRISADTGSGSVDVGDVEGDVLVDTGSGTVHVRDVRAASIAVDTGSGSVTLNNVHGSLTVDTGSGSVRAREIVSGELVSIGTGSGSVRLSGDLSAAAGIDIDTSSGSVELALSGYPGMRLDLSTGSGGISVRLPDVTAERDERNSFRGTVGDGSVRVRIDTGSGGITLRPEG